MDDKALAIGMRELLTSSVRHGASDLHLTTGRRPFIRRERQLTFISEHILSASEALRLNTVLLSPEEKKAFLEKKDLDYALAPAANERYRVNLMFHKDGAAGSYRMVPRETKTLTELGFDKHLDTLKRLLSYHNGLVLVTGPVGSGKTTTLAAMVAYLNETRKDHIITVEDPIEVVQPSKGCNGDAAPGRQTTPRPSSPRSRPPCARTPTSSSSGNCATWRRSRWRSARPRRATSSSGPCTRATPPRPSTGSSTSSPPSSRRRSAPAWPRACGGSSASASCPRPRAASSWPARSWSTHGDRQPRARWQDDRPAQRHGDGRARGDVPDGQRRLRPLCRTARSPGHGARQHHATASCGAQIT